MVLTMSLAGMLAGMAGAFELLGVTKVMTATFGTTVGFDAIAVAILGRTSPIGIILAALLFGALRTGAAAMQIQAGVPRELVDVLQATILFFLVASPVIQRVFRLGGARSGLEDATTFAKSYGGEAGTR
jgi:general nucleoside transport system permease protein